MNGEQGSNPNVGKYIGVYFAFGIGSASLVVIQTLILWIFCSIEVSDAIQSPLETPGANGTSRRRRESCMREWLMPFSDLL